MEEQDRRKNFRKMTMRERINSVVMSELGASPAQQQTKSTNQIEVELGYYLQVQHLGDPTTDLTNPYTQCALELLQKLNIDMPAYKIAFRTLNATLQQTLQQVKAHQEHEFDLANFSQAQQNRQKHIESQLARLLKLS